MSNINNISIYNERMDKSIEDKLWFVDKVDADIYVDFGCANGNLLKHLSHIHSKKGLANKLYIGYDISTEMINIAKKNCNRFNNIIFFNEFNDIRKYIDEYYNGKTICLVLSSVIHEVYSYSKEIEVTTFWFDIKNVLKPNYIAIRDMCCGLHDDSINIIYDIDITNIISYYVRKITEKGNKKQISDFENIWGEISHIKPITHFLLKYKYVENWDREVKENYLPISTFMVKSLLTNKYKIKYTKHYCLPYLKHQFKKDFDIDFIFSTHYNFLFELR